MTRRDTDGGPQADDGKECESSEFKRNLNGCPQADSFGERQLENNKYPRRTRRDTEGGPQAEFVGERESSGIKRELKKKLFMEINGIFMAIHVQNTDVVYTDDTEGHGWRSAGGRETGE